MGYGLLKTTEKQKAAIREMLMVDATCKGDISVYGIISIEKDVRALDIKDYEKDAIMDTVTWLETYYLHCRYTGHVIDTALVSDIVDHI